MASFAVDSVSEIRHTLGQHTAVTRAGNGDILAMYGDFTDQMEGQTGYLVRSRDGGESWGEPELAGVGRACAAVPPRVALRHDREACRRHAALPGAWTA